MLKKVKDFQFHYQTIEIRDQKCRLDRNSFFECSYVSKNDTIDGVALNLSPFGEVMFPLQ